MNINIKINLFKELCWTTSLNKCSLPYYSNRISFYGFIWIVKFSNVHCRISPWFSKCGLIGCFIIIVPVHTVYYVRTRFNLINYSRFHDWWLRTELLIFSLLTTIFINPFFTFRFTNKLNLISGLKLLLGIVSENFHFHSR